MIAVCQEIVSRSGRLKDEELLTTFRKLLEVRGQSETRCRHRCRPRADVSTIVVNIDD